MGFFKSVSRAVSSGARAVSNAAVSTASNPSAQVGALVGGNILGPGGALTAALPSFMATLLNQVTPQTQTPDIQKAPSAPTQSMANDVAYKSILQNEQNIRRSSPMTNYGGGRGLLDNPSLTSASSILLGS